MAIELKISIREPSGPLERKRRTDNSQFYFIQLGITEDEIFSQLAIIMRDQETVTAGNEKQTVPEVFFCLFSPVPSSGVFTRVYAQLCWKKLDARWWSTSTSMQLGCLKSYWNLCLLFL